MVEMGMGQQDVPEPAEAGPGLQQLALRTFAAIDQEAPAGGADEQCRQATLGRGRARGGAEKGQVEHALP